MQYLEAIPAEYTLAAIVGLVFASSYFLIVSIFRAVAAGRLRILMRLEGVRRLRSGDKDSEEALEAPFSERVLRPLFEKLSNGISSLAPKRFLSSMDRRLVLAGRPWGIKGGQFLTMQLGLVFLLGGGSLLVLFAVGTSMGRTVLISGFMAGLGLLVPHMIISQKIGARQVEVENALPDALDLLVVSVEAGLALDMAMAKVTEKMHGILAREFARTLHEIKLGKVRRQALRDMADRLGVNSLSSFISALIQADRLGVSMGNVLRLQSENMRRERRQRAEEKAMKAPIKMLIPMVFFIFPALFVIVLGPAVIQLSQVFFDKL
jgi:tight adherence protein C